MGQRSTSEDQRKEREWHKTLVSKKSKGSLVEELHFASFTYSKHVIMDVHCRHC